MAEDITKEAGALDIIKKNLKNAHQYEDYINNKLAKDFACEIAQALKEKEAVLDNPKSTLDVRQITYDFLTLSYPNQVKIAKKFGVYSDDDLEPKQRALKLWLARIKKEGKLTEAQAAIKTIKDKLK